MKPGGSVRRLHEARRLLSVVAVASLLAACGPNVPPSVSRSPSSSAAPSASDSGLVDLGGGIQGPPGFKATTWATGLANAAAIAPDDAGRLWVSTAAYNDPGHDGVYMVSAAGAVPQEVISGLNAPLGLLWFEGSLFVASTGQVIAYSRFEKGAFLQQRTILTLPSGVGESNQLVLAPDGRMQLGISAPCDHCTPTLADSAAIVSFLPDGTDLRVDATGIRAPVGLAYYPGTSDLLVTMNQRDDLGDATPGDWLALVRIGEAWGFPDCYGQGGSACTGVPAPIAVLDPHAGVAGLVVVTGQLGESVSDVALVAEWSTGQVFRVSLAPTSRGYIGTKRLFLSGFKNAVPLALLGNSLLVGDWGAGTIVQISPP